MIHTLVIFNSVSHTKCLAFCSKLNYHDWGFRDCYQYFLIKAATVFLACPKRFLSNPFVFIIHKTFCFDTTKYRLLKHLMFIGPCIIAIVDEWKTILMSPAILFHLLCAQHVSDINISIIRSLRLCCWITTSVVLFSVRCVLELLLQLIFGGVRFAGLQACKTNTTKYQLCWGAKVFCKAAYCEGSEVKVCKGLEVRLHLFLPSALDGIGLISFTRRSPCSRRNSVEYPLNRRFGVVGVRPSEPFREE